MKHTLLFPFQDALGAHFGSFGGWELPLWYEAGAAAEHRAVLFKTGLFDTGHMDLILLEGKGIRKLLQQTFSRNLEQCIGGSRRPLYPGRAIYGVFLDSRGYVLDDAVLYQLEKERYLLIVNAGKGLPILGHLEEFTEASTTSLRLLSPDIAKIDLQGPLSLSVLKPLLSTESVKYLQSNPFPYFSFRGSWNEDSEIRLKNGIPLFLSRTGYTGEFGFEIVALAKYLPGIWEILLEKGRVQGLLPCGLAARDSLRTGALLPLSGQDIGAELFGGNPWEFTLPKDSSGSFTKEFIGRSALEEAVCKEHTFAFAGYDPRKVDSHQARVETEGGQVLGRVLTCVTEPSLTRKEGGEIDISSEGRGLSCGFLRLSKRLIPGKCVFLVQGRRKIPVEIRSQLRPRRTALQPFTKMMEAPQ